MESSKGFFFVAQAKDLPYQTVDSTATPSTIDFDNAALAAWKAQSFHTTMELPSKSLMVRFRNPKNQRKPVEGKGS